MRGAIALALGYQWPAFYAVFAALGASILARRSADNLILAGPVAAALTSAMAWQYRFHSRTILFLVPALICLAVTGIEWASDRVARQPALRVALIVAALLGALSPTRLPRSVSTRDAIRPILAGVRPAWRGGDVLDVHYRA